MKQTAKAEKDKKEGLDTNNISKEFEGLLNILESSIKEIGTSY